MTGIVEWVLILTLVGFDSVAITQVPGFDTQQACVAAGRAWLKNTYPRLSPDNFRIVPNYTCVAR